MQVRELDETDGHRLISTSADAQALQPGDIRTIIERSDGIPLFIEEITKVVAHQRQLLDSGGHGPNRDKAFVIPPHLHDLLSARLDLLGTAKRAAQIAGLLGRVVDHRLLSDVLGWPEDELAAAIDKLLREGILVREAVAFPADEDEAQLQFRHTLIQQAAYQSMLVRERIALHARTLAILEADETHPALTRLALLAHHAEHAENFDHAIDCRYQLAQAALSRSSLDDATANVERAMALINHLPEQRPVVQRMQA